MVINGIFCGSISKFANASLQEASKIAYVTCHARLTHTSITFIQYLREFYSCIVLIIRCLYENFVIRVCLVKFVLFLVKNSHLYNLQFIVQCTKNSGRLAGKNFNVWKNLKEYHQEDFIVQKYAKLTIFSC
jgi:hypothetical protein